MEKKLIYIFLLAYIGNSLSCKKETGVKSVTSALNIINATTDASPLAINNSQANLPWFKNKSLISGNSFQEFSLQDGLNQLNLITSADTTKPFFSGKLNLITGSIYSLYVAGQLSHYDTLFMKDNIPYYGADSVAGARFINLVTDSQQLSINQVGNASPDFNSLAYKKITAFKRYPALSNIINNGGYNYEVRDADSNVLTTFNWVPATFKNNTLVITGLVSNGSVSVFAVNNY